MELKKITSSKSSDVNMEHGVTTDTRKIKGDNGEGDRKETSRIQVI